MHACARAQEGGPEQAQKVLQSFQSLVQAQLAKMEKDFKAGGSFPDLPVIQDIKAFQVKAPFSFPSLKSKQQGLSACTWHVRLHSCTGGYCMHAKATLHVGRHKALKLVGVGQKSLQGSIPLKPNNVTALSLSSTFFNYAPCLVSNDMVGAAATAVGLNIVPQARAHIGSPSCAACCSLSCMLPGA
jgi:hypothetical protein